MKFLNWILEARRGGTPKVSIIEALTKYKDDPDIYISYTSLEKLGINPQFDFGTPLGMYFYPLKEIWRHVENDQVPFAGERNWVWVVKAKGLLDLDTYNEKLFNRDLKTLEGIYPDLNTRFSSLDTFVYQNAKKDSLGRGLGTFMWYLTHNLAKWEDSYKTPFTWTKILRKFLGYRGIRDTHGIIHRNEPQQAIIFSLRDLQIVEKVKNIKPDTTERIITKDLKEYLDTVKDTSTGLDAIISNRITKTWSGGTKLIITKDNIFNNLSLKDFKLILEYTTELDGSTIMKLIKDSGYNEDFIKAAVDAKAIILIEDIESAVFYLKEFHIFNRIQEYFQLKTKNLYTSWTRALINIPKIIESFNAKKYIDFMEGLTKDRHLNIYDVFTAVRLIVDLKGGKQDALGYFIGDLYPRFLQVEAAKNHPETMDKVINLFKRDVIGKAAVRGLPSLDSLEKFIDKKYIEKFW